MKNLISLILFFFLFFSFPSIKSQDLTPDFIVDFDNPAYPTEGWTKGKGFLIENSTLLSVTYGWMPDGFSNNGTTGAMKVNIYGTACKLWSITPTIHLGSGTDYQMEFDLSLTAYGETTNGYFDSDDKFAVVISTDNGETWSSSNTLRQWTISDNLTALGEHIIIDLSDYSGDVKIGFYAESTSNMADNDLFVDNFSIGEAVEGPSILVNPNSLNFGIVNIPESETLNLLVSNIGTEELEITSVEVDAPFSCDFTGNVPVGENVNISVTYAPSENVESISSLTINSNAGNNNAYVIDLAGTSYPDDIALEDFEGDDFPPAGWIMAGEWAPFLSEEYTYGGVGTSAGVKGGTNESWLFSPKLNIENGDIFSFFYRIEDDYSPCGFEVRLASGDASQTDITAYTETILTVDVNSINWELISYTFNETYAGQDVYIAINRTWQSDDNYYAIIDNIYHPDIVENDVPNPVLFPSPQNEATSINAGILELSWEDVFLATGYKIYLGENENPSESDFTDIAEATNYSLENIVLDYSTTYFWSVIPYNENGDAENCPVFSFTTMDNPNLVPEFIFDFNDPPFPAENWVKATDLLGTNVELIGTTYGWGPDGFSNDGTTGAMRLNIYGYCTYWAITPPIDLGNDEVPYQMEFDLSLTQYNNTNASSLGEDDKFAIVISTDNGVTWSSDNILRQWTSTDALTVEGEHITIDLSDYSGMIKLAFYGESTLSNADNDLFVDNFAVNETADGARIQLSQNSLNFSSLSMGEEETLSFEIYNIGNEVLNISATNVAAPFYCDFTGSIQVGESQTVDITYTPTGTGDASVILTFESNALNNDIINLNLTGSAYSNTLVLQDFENETFPPLGWAMSETGWARSTDLTHVYEGEASARVREDDASWLFTPKMQIENGDVFSFLYQTESVDYPSGLEVRLALGSSSQTDITAYTEIILNLDNINSLTWEQISYVFDETYAGQEVYLAFHRTWQTATYYFAYIDNVIHPAIVLGGVPNPIFSVFPENESTDVPANIEELTWEDAFLATGYKVYIGENENPTEGDFIDIQDATAFSLENFDLDYLATYYWSVIPYNENGDAVNCPVFSFTVENNPILTPEFTVDFSGPSSILNWTEKQGILEEEVIFTADGSTWTVDGFSNTGFTGAMRINIYGTNCKYWLITAPIDLGGEEDNYQLEFDLSLTQYNNTNASVLGEDDKFAVVISTDGGETWSSTNILRQWTHEDNLTPAGENIIIDLSEYSGVVKFGFYGESLDASDASDNDLFIDNVAVKNAIDCSDYSIDLGDDIVYCENTDYPINVDDNYTTYVWSLNGEVISDANTNELVVNTEAGTYNYSLLATMENSCQVSDDITITALENAEVDLGEDQSFCFGEQENYTITIPNANTSDTYSWTLNGENIEETTSEVIASAEVGVYNYSATVTNDSSCESTDNITVTIFEVPELDLGDDINAIAGDEIILNANPNNNTNISSYTWNNNETTQTITVTENGTYEVEITTINACTASDEIIVSFDVKIENIDNERSFINIYPNPAVKNIYINTILDKNSNVEITNLKGQILYQNKLENVVNGIDISNFSKGIYLVKVKYENKEHISKLIIE